MIRFQPDNLTEALLRFAAMAAPDGNVYVEIAAPDLRFAAMTLAAAGVLLIWRRLAVKPWAAVALLLFLLACTPIWLITSGNGRYFMPLLLVVGPLTVALLHLLPLTRMFRVFLAAGLLGAQSFVVWDNPPWDTWAWAAWSDGGYYPVTVSPRLAAEQGATYVTASTISYSLIAPQFPATSRWISITAVGGAGRDAEWGREFLRAARGPIRLVVPTVPGQVLPDGQPRPEVRQALDRLIGKQNLGLVPDVPCELLPSRGLEATISRSPVERFEGEKLGFWVCPLNFPVQPPAETQDERSVLADAVFARVEGQCPRFFPPGGITARVGGGTMRAYPGSDMKLYVMDDGTVIYKFWRALNPVLIGRAPDILSGAAPVRCEHIRGRSGLPWEREI